MRRCGAGWLRGGGEGRPLLAGKAEPNATDSVGASPLHIAASAGYLEAIVALAVEGADTYARDADGATALHRAVSGSHSYAVVYLLDLSADPTLRDKGGRSALDLWGLMMACSST